MFLCNEGEVTKASNNDGGSTVEELTINLRPQALALLAEVEEKYAKKVVTEAIRGWKPTDHGTASVTKDGTPVIQLSAATGGTEATVVHELFHLKLKADGFPATRYILATNIENKQNREFLAAVDLMLFETIEHWIFYPEMRAMGIDPSPELTAVAESGDYKTLDQNDFRKLALYYLRANLLIEDQAILSVMTEWYHDNQRAALGAAGRLMAIVKDSNPKTPKEEIVTYTKCYNFLFKGVSRLEEEKWTAETFGKTKINIAPLRLIPVR